jgi:hypothetical protein
MKSFPVDFVICGAQKSGTTALSQFLRQHPQVCLCKTKEGHFFDDDERFERGAAKLRDYHKLFDVRPEHRAIGEPTPIYMYWHPCLARIWQYNPGMKLIALLRNPVDRAYSHWQMEHGRGLDPLDFSTAIRTEESRCRVALPRQHRVFSYISRGFYTEQLRRMHQFFPPAQCLILRNEQLEEDHAGTLKTVFRFLGVDPDVAVPQERVFAQDYPPMADADRNYLARIFHHEIKQLELMLGWDLSTWLDGRERP